MRPLKKYAQFSGRAPRAEFWWFYLATLVVGFIADVVDRVTGSEFGVLGLVFSLGVTIPSIAVTVRRLHDTSRTGWWLFAVLVPAAIFGFQASQAALARQFETSELAPSMWVSTFGLVAACVVLLIFMVLPGTKGSNGHGPDPYGEHEDMEAVFS